MLRRPGLARWISGHPDDVAACVVDGSGEVVLAHRPDALMPLASTVKVLILGAYADAVVAGRLDPAERVPLAAVEHFHLPGTDGGAHPRALADARAQGLVEGGSLSLDSVVRAMVRWSDNAATDLVLERVGGPAAVGAHAAAHGLVRQEPVVAILELFTGWSTAGHLPSVQRQRELALTSPRGCAGELAAWLHGMAVSGTPASAIVRDHLGWPLRAFAANAQRWQLMLAKGGSLPGIRTNLIATQGQAEAGPTTTALLLRGLPAGLEGQLRRSFADQALIIGPGVPERLAGLLPVS